MLRVEKRLNELTSKVDALLEGRLPRNLNLHNDLLPSEERLRNRQIAAGGPEAIKANNKRILQELREEAKKKMKDTKG
jgi:hypothetical protein